MPLALLFTFRPETICFWNIVAADFWTRKMRGLRSTLQRAFWNTLG
jgi:hypothetical protein